MKVMENIQETILNRDLFNMFGSVEKVQFTKEISTKDFKNNINPVDYPPPSVKRETDHKVDGVEAGESKENNLYWIW